MSIADIIANAHAHESRMLAASREVLEQHVAGMADHARTNRPWTDRTGEARDKLASVPIHPARLEDGGAVALVHGAAHGVFLELANASRYATIQPTVATEAPQLTQRLRDEVWK